MADAKLPRNDARPNSGRGHLDDLEPDVVGQRPSVDEDAAKLVDSALTFEAKISEKRKILINYFSLKINCIYEIIFLSLEEMEHNNDTHYILQKSIFLILPPTLGIAYTTINAEEIKK